MIRKKIVYFIIFSASLLGLIGPALSDSKSNDVQSEKSLTTSQWLERIRFTKHHRDWVLTNEAGSTPVAYTLSNENAAYLINGISRDHKLIVKTTSTCMPEEHIELGIGNSGYQMRATTCEDIVGFGVVYSAKNLWEDELMELLRNGSSVSLSIIDSKKFRVKETFVFSLMGITAALNGIESDYQYLKNNEKLVLTEKPLHEDVKDMVSKQLTSPQQAAALP